MGIKFAKDTLLAALKTSAAFAGKFMVEREGLPREQMTLIRLMFNGAGRLVIEATNLEMGIHMEIPAPGSSETRSYQLPIKTLIDAVSAAGGTEIELVHEKAGLGVKTQTGKSTIKNVAGDDLIPLLDCGAAATTTSHFTCDEMAKAINMVAFAAAKEDDARPYLCGVRIMPEHSGSVSFVAADGVRMAVYTTQTTTPEAFSTPFTLPIASVPAITNCLAIQHGNVALTVISNRAIFHWNWDENNFNGYVFALRQADNFPDWHTLVPRTCKTKITFDGALAAALKTARVIARESDELPKVTLKINDLKAVVESEVAEVGATSTEVTPISVEGMNGVEVSFNVNLVPLAQIGASGTVIGLNPPQEGTPGPIIWKLPSVEGWQYLLMPLRSF